MLLVSMNQNIPIKSVERSFDIVRMLQKTDKAGVSELAKELALPTSTVHDHLQTLESRGYVTKIDGTYRLGTQFLYIGDKLRRQNRTFQSCRQELRNLADDTGEHASLTIEESGLGIIFHHVRGEKAIEFNTYPGRRTKLHLSAAGKAILASLSNDRVDEIVDKHGLRPRTDNSISSRAELEEELIKIRDREYALDDEGGISGMRGVGVPLFDQEERVLGAISLYGPRSRIDDSRFRNDLPNRLHEGANVIEIEYNFK